MLVAAAAQVAVAVLGEETVVTEGLVAMVAAWVVEVAAEAAMVAMVAEVVGRVGETVAETAAAMAAAAPAVATVAATWAVAEAAGSRTDLDRVCKCLRDSCTSGSCRRCRA